MRNDEVTVEEKLQDSNASAGNRAMAGGVSWMGWRTFGECLRKKVIPMSVETPLHSDRVENVVINSAIQSSPVVSQNLANDSAARLGTMTQMDVPLVIPHAVQRKASDGRHHRCEVGLTEGSKAVLCAGVDVRISGVQRHTERVKGLPLFKALLNVWKALKFTKPIPAWRMPLL